MGIRSEKFIPKFTPEMVHGVGSIHGLAPAVVEAILCQYDLKEEIIEIGPHTLNIISLASLDQTIDQVFEFLQAQKIEHHLNALSPYFGQVWPSGLALAKWISRKLPRGEAVGQSFMELGCGLALPTWIAARMGWKGVATDSHPHVGSFFNRNGKLNFGDENLPKVKFEPLVWSEAQGRPVDLLLASDVLYESHHPGDLALAAQQLLKNTKDARFYLADPGRPYLQKAVDCLTAQGFRYQMEAMTCLEKEIFLFEFNY